MKALKLGFLLLCVMLPLLLFAQNTGSITGIATDPSGAVVQGAKVTVTNQAINLARTVATNASGFYSVTNLVPGVYSVTLEKEGFSTVKIENTPLTVAQALVLNASFL